MPNDEATSTQDDHAASAAADTAAEIAAGSGGGEAAMAAVPSEPLFEPDELDRLDADDVHAGRAIGTMLALFFLYTVIATAMVGWWTYGSNVR